MLVSGGCLVIARPEGHTDPPYMATLIRQQRVSFMIAVPTLAALYLEALRPEPCDTLRAIAMGGKIELGQSLQLMVLCCPALPHDPAKPFRSTLPRFVPAFITWTTTEQPK